MSRELSPEKPSQSASLTALPKGEPRQVQPFPLASPSGRGGTASAVTERAKRRRKFTSHSQKPPAAQITQTGDFLFIQILIHAGGTGNLAPPSVLAQPSLNAFRVLSTALFTIFEVFSKEEAKVSCLPFHMFEIVPYMLPQL